MPLLYPLRLITLMLAFSFSCLPVFAANTKAPELPKNLEWLNVDKPLDLEQLKGKFVLLDFWTYCCINCQHILPDLKKLEEKYAKELVVIGVHSAKFESEGETDNIREAVLRYGITHPVVNDPQLEAWQSYGINAWPTLVLIDPKGEIIFRKSGEGVFSPVDTIIKKSLDQYKPIETKPLVVKLEKDKNDKGVLDFPGKIVGDDKGERLFIADSGHNRILVTNLAGEIQTIIEGGFNNPQGLAYGNNYLYVADTGNHLIKRIELVNKTVTTIAGTGKQGFERAVNAAAMTASLSSPWDLVLVESKLYIAMAGLHQIWEMDLNKGFIKTFAGSGQENIVDGPLNKASLAQTSGITSDGKQLFFVDSETSSVRRADLGQNGEVTTIIGHGLFEFGNVDGDKDTARFQHPLGIYYHQGKLYVADTYNNAIKVVDPINKNSRTFTSAESSLNEPGGITFVQGRFYIADTNNHRICILDPLTSKVEDLKVHEKSRTLILNTAKFNGDQHILKAQKGLKAFKIKLNIDRDYELLNPSQSFVRIYNERKELVDRLKINDLLSKFEFSTEFKDRVYLEVVIYFCRHTKEGLCLIKNTLFEIPLDPGYTKENIDLIFDLPAGTYQNID